VFDFLAPGGQPWPGWYGTSVAQVSCLIQLAHISLAVVFDFQPVAWPNPQLPSTTTMGLCLIQAWPNPNQHQLQPNVEQTQQK
jgi:hypothetical protein